MFNTTITQPCDAINSVIQHFIIPRFTLASYKDDKMSGIRTRSRQDKEDDKYDSIAKTVIDSTILASLVTTLTGAITTMVSNASTDRPTSGITNTHSSTIDPYDTRFIHLKTKAGKYQWYIVTNPKPGWILLTVTVENADKLMDLFKYLTFHLVLNIIMKIPTAGIGSTKTASQTILGIDCCNTDLNDDKDLLNQFYQVTIDQVRTSSGWFMGYKLFSITTYTDINVKAIDPNVARNLGLVNQ